MIEFCKSTGLRILNGRVIGDLAGNFTCYSRNCIYPSVIDYSLVCGSLFNHIEYFRVLPLHYTSIHCITSTSLRLRHYQSHNDDETLTDLHAFKWSKENAQTFVDSLNSEQIKTRINNLLQSTDEIQTFLTKLF